MPLRGLLIPLVILWAAVYNVEDFTDKVDRAVTPNACPQTNISRREFRNVKFLVRALDVLEQLVALLQVASVEPTLGLN